MIDSPCLHFSQYVWKWIGGRLGPRIFPPLFCPSLTGSSHCTHFAANLTICLLARSPTATSACTLNCCWRRTKKHCFPGKENNNKLLAVKSGFWPYHKEKLRGSLWSDVSLFILKVLIFILIYNTVHLKCQTFVNGSLSLKSAQWRKGDCYLPNKQTQTHTHLGTV